MSNFYAAVDLGGTHFSVGVADEGLEVLAERKYATQSEEGPSGVLRRIRSAIRELAGECGAGDLRGVGIGIPGLVDLATGTVKFLPNLATQWRDVPISAIVGDDFGCPVAILNDARAAALGELHFGRGRNVDTMVYLGIGTGIGGAVVVDGRLRLGPLGAAGEIGHVQVSPEGPACGCGSRGCLETLVSGPALVGEGVRLLLSGNAPLLHGLVAGKTEKVTPALLGDAARSGDAGPLRAIERAGERMGTALSAVVTTLDPDLIVLGGGVSALADLLIPPLRKAIVERVRMFPVDRLRVERSSLDDRGGLLGALALAAGRATASARDR